MESNPTLKIVYGVVSEAHRVEQAIQRLPWYRQQGYKESHIKLPKGIDENSSSEQIKIAIESEFDSEKYTDYATHIKSEWPKFLDGLRNLTSIPNFKLGESYTLILTKYGSGGSYHSDRNVIYSNIDFRSKDNITGTIIHELIHIGIQHLIDKYKVLHWRKERLVDLIGSKIFPGLREEQNIKEDTGVVDDAFESHYPDIEKITQTIGNVTETPQEKKRLTKWDWLYILQEIFWPKRF